MGDKSAEILNEQNQKITDSIRYAKKIQSAILPDINELSGIFADYYIVSKPIDLVSGDFYWFSKIDGQFYIAVVDCSGYGIPGAFISMIGHTILNRVILEEKIYKTDEILNNINASFCSALKKKYLSEDIQGEMNISLCMIDFIDNKLYFSGALNPLYYVKDGKFKELEGNDYPIGKDKKNTFNSHEVEISGDMSIYLTTEGFHYDKNLENSHIESLQTINLIISNASHPFEIQKDNILKEMDQYNFQKVQTDDFTIIGIKLS